MKLPQLSEDSNEVAPHAIEQLSSSISKNSGEDITAIAEPTPPDEGTMKC